VLEDAQANNNEIIKFLREPQSLPDSRLVDVKSRKLLAAAMLLDIVPMGVFAMHMFRATHE
jgi:hypothetical protein